MEAMIEFLYMDGYAGYVWSAYGISFVILLLGVLMPMRREQAWLHKLRRLNLESR